jgi:hypothetical protein
MQRHTVKLAADARLVVDAEASVDDNDDNEPVDDEDDPPVVVVDTVVEVDDVSDWAQIGSTNQPIIANNTEKISKQI